MTASTSSSPPVVSVILPVYNGEKYLSAAIESVLHQTFSDFELIIIDDSSTDQTPQIIQHFKDNRILYIHNNQNGGVAYSLNKGVELARGKYIARMDADDISLPDRFIRQLEALEICQELDILGTQVILMDETLSYPVGQIDYPIMHSEIVWQFLFNNALAHPSIMGKREIFLNKYDEGKIAVEDYDLWTRLVGDVIFGNLPEQLVIYRRHESTITHQHEEMLEFNKIGIIKSYIYKIARLDIPEEEIKLLDENERKVPLSQTEYKKLINILFQVYMGLIDKHIILEKENSLVYQCFLDQVLSIFSVNSAQRKTSIRDRVKENLPKNIYSALKKVKRILPNSLLKKIY
jgi:glycosyltransferase involved in cell wall biosynthesis